MSQSLPPAGALGSQATPRKTEDEKAKSIYLVSYPKVVFLYPTFLAAIVCGLYMAIAQRVETDTHMLSVVFLTILGLNLVIFAFDFPRTTSLTLFFFLAAVVFALLTFFRFKDIVPWLQNLLASFQPQANATFYFSVATVLGSIFIAVLINVQFDYWEVTPNELLHHHGVLSNLERFSAPNLKIDKEITDVFEYALLRSGRLILHPSTEPRAIVLENVTRINTKQEKLTRMLGALQVQVRPAPPVEAE